MALSRAVKRGASFFCVGLVILTAVASCGGAPQPREPRRVSAPPELMWGRVSSTSSAVVSGESSNGKAGGLLAKGTPDVEPAAPAVVKEKSSLLPSGLHNPMPGGVFAGYRADTGLDIAGSPRPVYAIQSGTLDYSEPGHTLWTGPKDTANCVRFKLDAPIPWKGGRMITHVYYAHLSKLEYNQPEGSRERRRIDAGERLGVSGTANHSPHLHIGLLLDGEVEQYSGTFLLEDEVRRVLGGYRNGTRLPRE